MAKKHRFLLILGIVLALIVAAIVITPFFVNADTFRPQIEQALGSMLHRKVEIGHLRVSILQGSLVANRISISDDPTYSQQPFLTAKSLAVGIALEPLIFSRRLEVHSLTIASPQVQLLRTAQGNWNFDSLGGSAAAAPAPADPSTNSGLQGFSVGQMAITNGTIAFGRAGQPTRLAYVDVNISASQISPTAPFPLTFDADTPGHGTIHLKANVGPVAESEAGRLPFQGQLNVNNVPSEDVQNLLAVLGYGLPQGSSLKGGTIQANLDLHGPFERLVTSGPVKLTNVRLAGFSLAGELARALGTANAATGNDTLVQVASSDLRYTPNGLEASNLNVIIPILGTLTGSGTVGANNALNFRLVAKLAGSSPIAQLVRLPILSQQGGGGLPLRIEGTTAHPKIVPDLSGSAVGTAVGSVIQQFTNPKQKQQSGGIGGILGGLLGKKKTQQKQPQH